MSYSRFLFGTVAMLAMLPGEYIAYEVTTRPKERDDHTGLTDCRRCSIVSGSEACWDQSLEHFTEELELALNRYVLALQYVNQWKHYIGKYQDYKGYEAEILKKVLDKFYSADYDNDHGHGPLSREDVETVFSLALNKTDSYNELYGENETVPVLHCPTTCDYYQRVWRTLFTVTVVACFLFVVFFCAHACWRRRKIESHVLLVNS